MGIVCPIKCGIKKGVWTPYPSFFLSLQGSQHSVIGLPLQTQHRSGLVSSQSQAILQILHLPAYSSSAMLILYRHYLLNK